AHSLHIVHRSLIHSGTSNATPRFSTAAVPKGIRPSVIPFFASEVGLGGRINTAMETAFFKLAQIMPFEQVLPILKEEALKSY
ncbi:hypothetical protein, partial [Enterococcus faecalis]|uniref:hypothetical protein n=1 Tax=Enterococcus faecalis TaxID=1351 RepID=UPI0032DAB6A0